MRGKDSTPNAYGGSLASASAVHRETSTKETMSSGNLFVGDW